jgi:hypothetical protein
MIYGETMCKNLNHLTIETTRAPTGAPLTNRHRTHQRYRAQHRVPGSYHGDQPPHPSPPSSQSRRKTKKHQGKPISNYKIIVRLNPPLQVTIAGVACVTRLDSPARKTPECRKAEVGPIWRPDSHNRSAVGWWISSSSTSDGESARRIKA